MRRCAPFLVLLGLVVVLATAGVTAWDVEEPSAAEVSPTTTEGVGLTAPGRGVPAGRCGRVTYTPPTASDRHRATLCRPADAPRGLVVLIHGGGASAWDWHLVVPLLEAAGHQAVAVDLPIEEENADLEE